MHSIVLWPFRSGFMRFSHEREHYVDRSSPLQSSSTKPQFSVHCFSFMAIITLSLCTFDEQFRKIIMYNRLGVINKFLVQLSLANWTELPSPKAVVFRFPHINKIVHLYLQENCFSKVFKIFMSNSIYFVVKRML